MHVWQVLRYVLCPVPPGLMAGVAGMNDARAVGDPLGPLGHPITSIPLELGTFCGTTTTIVDTHHYCAEEPPDSIAAPPRPRIRHPL